MSKDLFSRLAKVNRSKEKAGTPLTPGRYLLAGRDVRCPHCEGDTFIEGNAQVNTTVSSALLGIDYKKVYTLICTECGYLQWMMNEPLRQLDDDLFG